MSAADWVVVAEFAVALVGLITFVVFYALSSHFRAFRTPEGRHLLHFRSGLIAWMVMAIVHNLIEAYPGRDFVRIFVVGWVAAASVEGAYLVIRAQRARRRSDRDAASTGQGLR